MENADNLPKKIQVGMKRLIASILPAKNHIKEKSSIIVHHLFQELKKIICSYCSNQRGTTGISFIVRAL